MSKAIDRLIAAQPSFHAWPDGRPANWSVAPDVLRYIAARVKPGMNTLETGAGHTTVMFCAAGARHISVTPDAAQAARIREYLKAEGIAAELTFLHESSDVALPGASILPDRLDFVLVDGAHRFPFPIIDWHYTESRVPVGGIVAVDDCQMPSVRILYSFLAGEDDWRLVDEIGVTAFFERLRKAENVWDWSEQTINKAFHAQVTADVMVHAPEDPATDDPLPDEPAGRSPEIELRAAKLQLRALDRQVRTFDRDLRATQHTLRQTRDELWRIKGSLVYRALRRMQQVATTPRRLLRRVWPA
jgi:hypothetical protein